MIKNEFDLKASTWDKNTVHVERSDYLAKQLTENIEFIPTMKAMDFGAGTALLSFKLKDRFESITLVDNSTEMLKVCDEKIKESKSKNIHTLKIDLEKEDISESYDIIYSQMAFHHISDLKKVINKLFNLLNDNGILAVADLYRENGSFHGEGFTGHKGFDPEMVAELMRNTGFSDVSYQESFRQKQIDKAGKIAEYPMFLIIAKKIRKQIVQK